ncbi:MAG: alpha-E domain-containing protein [Halioglobus sp.]|nr:alpha-E domain-containing protein [Halioglobus sp.]
MLSRVAERLYWAARYLERAEDTARLTLAYTHLVMDIPDTAAPGWDILVRIQDASDNFLQRHRAFNELNVLHFLIADIESPGSIQSSLIAARENVRTTRDVLPADVWEHVNELYLYTRENAEGSVRRRRRQQFLDQVIARCQMITGLIITTLCRDHAYRFIMVGQLLERADMTTRIINVGTSVMLQEERHYTTVDPLIWASLLESLSAMGTYRRTIGPLVESAAVVDFVLRDPTLPRSVRFCLDLIRRELHPLKNGDAAMRVLESAKRSLARFPIDGASRDDMHRFIDRFQLRLQELDQSIRATWFLPPKP